MDNRKLFRSNSWASLFPGRIKISPQTELRNHLNPVHRFCISRDKPVILIDWDGCLVDSSASIANRLLRVFQKLKETYGDKLDVTEETVKTPWTREFNDHMKFIFGEKYEKEAGTLYKSYMENEKLNPKAFDGSKEFLQKLRDANIPFAIVTNSWHMRVKESINILGWQDVLNDVPIVASDNLDTEVKPKPHPSHFTCALQRLGFNITKRDQREIIVIGDGIESDMTGALKLSSNFNIRAVWINHGKKVKCELSSYANFEDVAEDILPKPVSLNIVKRG